MQSTTDLTQEEEDVEGPCQGTIVEAEICIEGQLVMALIDTGSPISIVSIDLLLQIMNLNQPEDTSKKDWLSSFRSWLKLPRMTVKTLMEKR